MNLLVDPVFDTGTGMVLSLPALFAASARGEVRSFPRVRAHQRTAWHMFRVQLAALALRGGGVDEPPTEPGTWIDLLRALTPDLGDDPWRLIVEDRSVPAFLQPPDPGGLKWDRVVTPDALDVLITARNHDVKRAIAETATAEDWVHALVTEQTSEGYGGRGQYGIARMNGGSSSRPFLGLVPTGPGGVPDPSAWWVRDVAVLLERQGDETPMTRGGPALLWCHPWEEGRCFAVQNLDPWAIEVCRRLRLSERDGRIVAERAGSKAARVEAKAFNGALGDAWAPVTSDSDGRKALTLGEGRFDYRRIHALVLSGDWEIPIAARVREDETVGDMSLLAEALSRGNSKTDGLKSRLVPMPKRALGLFRNERQLIADVAAVQLQEIEEVDAILREAVALYAAGGNRVRVGRDERRRATEARGRLDRAADAAFFEHLWSRVASAGDDVDAEERAAFGFRKVLVGTARRELERAFGAVPCASVRKPAAQARARARLEGGLRARGLVETETTEESGVESE